MAANHESSAIFADNKKRKSPFRISLRYKLAFPVILFVSLMIFVLFTTTFTLVRSLVIEGVEQRLKALTNVFTETLKAPLILEQPEDLLEILNWMGKQSHVTEIRLEDWEGTVAAKTGDHIVLPEHVLDPDFSGTTRITSDQFVVAAPIHERDRKLGRVLVVYSGLGVESHLKQIFQERLLMAFLMILILALMVMLITWVAIRPLFKLEKVAKRILGGDLDARTDLHSFDETEDMSEAFDEMVNRLSQSLDRLRMRTEALEESEEKFRLIVENANDIIFTLTPDGELMLLNKGFSGCTREELLHDGLALMLSVHSPESRMHFQAALEDVMRKKTAVNNLAVSHLLRGSKSEIFYLVNFTPVLGHEGDVKLIQGIMRDVTEMRRLEMMKESLIRDVAHELKTPAAKFSMAITWFEKEMRKQNEYEKYEQILYILKNNVDRLMHTITSIMDLSKLEAGMDRITKEELDLNVVLKDVERDMRPLIESKKIEFESRYYKDKLLMMGDAHMIYRLFVNLLQNALKFTEVGKITMTTSVSDGHIHVRVHDTGCGIEGEDLESIFDRFVQKTAASSGIGVGLTISRDIAALHNGKIWADSQGLGKGATFHVLFPIV